LGLNEKAKWKTITKKEGIDQVSVSAVNGLKCRKGALDSALEKRRLSNGIMK